MSPGLGSMRVLPCFVENRLDLIRGAFRGGACGCTASRRHAIVYAIINR
jgi:hypothetical protein